MQTKTLRPSLKRSCQLMTFMAIVMAASPQTLWGLGPSTSRQPLPGKTSIHTQAAQEENRQVGTIRGIVTDEKGEPLIGVSVIAKDANLSTVTDMEGSFMLNVQSGTQLTFSYIGYEELTATATAGHVMKIQMHDTENSLNEVVVIGYGTQRKET